MRVYAIGRQLEPGVTGWPESPHLTIADGVELAIFFNDVTDDEVQGLAGQAEFGWIDSDHSGMLVFRFGSEPVGLPWQSCPYNPHLSPQYVKAAAAGQDRPQLVAVVLVDARSGVVRALRLVSWPSLFIDAVTRTTERLAGQPPNLGAHDAAIAALYAQYPNNAALSKRADITCTGGDVAANPEGTYL